VGLTIRLTTESGKQLGEVLDPQNLLHHLLPASDDRSFPLLRFVDRYGDTVFNYLQAEALVDELTRLHESQQGIQGHTLLVDLRHLASECSREAHRYLRFVGD